MRGGDCEVRLDWTQPEKAARLWKLVTRFVAARCDRFQIRYCWWSSGLKHLVDPAGAVRLAGLFDEWGVADPQPLEEAVAGPRTAETESRFGPPPPVTLFGPAEDSVRCAAGPLNEETILAITGWESDHPFDVLEEFHHMEFFRGGEWVFTHNESYSVRFDLPDEELQALARALEEEGFDPGVIGRVAGGWGGCLGQ